MTSYYAAVDIGASSGRLILGWLEDGKLRLREVHQFQKQPAQESCFPMFHPLATRSPNLSVFLIVAEFQISAISAHKFPATAQNW